VLFTAMALDETATPWVITVEPPFETLDRLPDSEGGGVHRVIPPEYHETLQWLEDDTEALELIMRISQVRDPHLLG
jgi:hypothetical protein